MIETGGRAVRLELTRDGLTATPRFSRMRWRMPLKMVALLVMAQSPEETVNGPKQRSPRTLPLLRSRKKGKESELGQCSL